MSSTLASAAAQRIRGRLALLELAAGVDPTGTTECAAAVQTEIDRAKAAGLRLVGAGIYRIGSKVVLKGSCDLSDCEFRIQGAPAVGVEISTGVGANPTTILAGVTISAPNIINTTKPGLGWVGQGIGLRLVNAQNASITLGKIQEFSVGLDLTAYSQGCVYNDIRGGTYYNNKVQVRIGPGNATGWTNDNTISCGSALFISGEGTAVSGTRTILSQHFATGNIINNNRFIGFDFEGEVAEYLVEDQGCNATYLACRWESAANRVWLNATPISPSTIEGVNIIGGYAPNSIATTISGNAFGITIKVSRKTGVTFLDQGEQWSTPNGDTTPALTLFPSTVTAPWSKTAAATDWLVQLTGRTLVGKKTGDAAAALRAGLDFDQGFALAEAGLKQPSTGARLLWCTGTPEAAVTAPRGSLAIRLDGGALTTLYVKESGVGNTGWVAK